MTTSTTENEPAAQATAAAARKPEAPNKAHATARKPHLAPFKAKSRKKPNSRKRGWLHQRNPEKEDGAALRGEGQFFAPAGLFRDCCSGPQNLDRKMAFS